MGISFWRLAAGKSLRSSVFNAKSIEQRAKSEGHGERNWQLAASNWFLATK
jgi:hypothetical protein